MRRGLYREWDVGEIEKTLREERAEIAKFLGYVDKWSTDKVLARREDILDGRHVVEAIDGWLQFLGNEFEGNEEDRQEDFQWWVDGKVRELMFGSMRPGGLERWARAEAKVLYEIVWGRR